VFDRLEMPVLYQIASQIAPRKMSDILGLMSPDVAERLTTEMARRAGPDHPPPPRSAQDRADASAKLISRDNSKALARDATCRLDAGWP